MAPRPPYALSVAIVMAGLLSSCLLLTDTEVAEPLTDDTEVEDTVDDQTPITDSDVDDDSLEDTGVVDRGGDGEPGIDVIDDVDVAEDADQNDMPADASDADRGDLDLIDVGPADGDQRCLHRTVEAYRAETEGWEETEVCTRDQYCLEGACVALPEGFGDACDGDCDGDGLECIDEVCLTHAPSDVGEDCIGHEECLAELLCTRRGLCQAGAVSDPCMDTEDCDPAVAPICDGDVCAPSGVGEPCVGDESCASDALYCGPGDFCRAGSEGDPCGSTEQCARTDRYCGPDDVCHDGSTEDPCDDTPDCVEDDDICKGDTTKTCQDRIEDDPCGGDVDCPGALYCASSVCQDGTTGDHCDTTDDCVEADDICKDTPKRCLDRAEGDTCGDDDECPTGLYCASSVSECRDGSTGDFCDATADCDQIDDICKKATPESPLRCQDRTEGDACDTPLQCPALYPICSTVGECQDGSIGDGCGEHNDCAVGLHCDDEGQCVDGDPALFEPCSSDDRCASDNCLYGQCVRAEFVYIPPGTFCMGSPDGETECMGETPISEPGRNSSETFHEVTLTRAFFIQQTEVTQRQWEAMAFANPSYFKACGLDCAVERVNWWEAVAYVNALERGRRSSTVGLPRQSASLTPRQT